MARVRAQAERLRITERGELVECPTSYTLTGRATASPPKPIPQGYFCGGICPGQARVRPFVPAYDAAEGRLRTAPKGGMLTQLSKPYFVWRRLSASISGRTSSGEHPVTGALREPGGVFRSRRLRCGPPDHQPLMPAAGFIVLHYHLVDSAILLLLALARRAALAVGQGCAAFMVGSY